MYMLVVYLYIHIDVCESDMDIMYILGNMVLDGLLSVYRFVVPLLLYLYINRVLWDSPKILQSFLCEDIPCGYDTCLRFWTTSYLYG